MYLNTTFYRNHKLADAENNTIKNTVKPFSPFGMVMSSRSFSSTAYKYGFNGQEKDDEVDGEGNSENYKYRIYDPRLGRFYSCDPLSRNYMWNSPYAFCENRVIELLLK